MAKKEKPQLALQMPKEVREQLEVFNRLTTDLLLLVLDATGNGCNCNVCQKVREMSKDLKRYLELGLKAREKVG